MQDEMYSRYVAIGGILPVTRSVAVQYADDPYIKAFLEQEVAAPPPFPRVGRALDILGAYVERFSYGHLEADEMLDRAQRDIDALLIRNRSRE